MGRYAIWKNDAEQSVYCVYSPCVVVIAYILTVYRSINAKRSPHALYQNMRTSLVGAAGLEPARSKATNFKSVASAIPPCPHG